MLFVAEEVRTIIAALGYSSLDEIIGRRDLLRPRSDGAVRTNLPQPAVASQQTIQSAPPKKLTKVDSVDLSSFYAVEKPDEDLRVSWVGAQRNSTAHSNGPVLDDEILADTEVAQLIDNNEGTVEKEFAVCNIDRSVAGRVAGVVASKHGDDGFKGTLKLNFTGSAGQSLGVFNTQGVHIRVTGDCNDYVGKSMSGGSIVCVPPEGSSFDSSENVIAGNTCLYGATGGEVFLNGRVGERFGVRNAGCHAVIEGSGDHMGEYMTNGVIVALGDVGRNVAAGMSGGLLYIYDPEGNGLKMNDDNKSNIFRVTSSAAQEQLQGLIQKHSDSTGSRRAAEILQSWESSVGCFWQVAPASMQQSELVSLPDAVSETQVQNAVVAAASGKKQAPEVGRNTWGASSPRAGGRA